MTVTWKLFLASDSLPGGSTLSYIELGKKLFLPTVSDLLVASFIVAQWGCQWYGVTKLRCCPTILDFVGKILYREHRGYMTKVLPGKALQ